MAEANAKGAGRAARPLSPHIRIYRPLNNMVASITHRITGAVLYVGTLLLAWWLVALAMGPGPFNFINGLLASPAGLLVMLGFTWALIQHLVGGIRHLIWDTGRGFALSSVNTLSWMSFIVSILATAAIAVWVARLKGMI